jgi:hypothetical protein
MSRSAWCAVAWTSTRSLAYSLPESWIPRGHGGGLRHTVGVIPHRRTGNRVFVTSHEKRKSLFQYKRKITP